MNKKKIIALSIGVCCIVALIIGLILLASNNPIKLATAITIICLSLAFGLLIPNPICLFGLIAGILMIILPANVTGIILICFAVIGALANGVVYYAMKKSSS